MASNGEEIIKVPLLSASSEDVTFSLLGTQDFPLVEAVLQPGCSMCAEPGRMIGMPEGVHFHTVMGDGTEAGIFSNMKKAASRMFSGESFMMARFTNETEEAQTLRFGTVVPGNVVPVNLQEYGGEIIGAGGVYFAGSDGLHVESCFRQRLGAAFFGGESFILQRISGEGAVLLQGGGVVVKQELTPQRPTLRVDTGCLVAFTSRLTYDIALAGGLKSMIFGGEGIFHATISLPPGETRGTVWVESFPYSKYISMIKSYYPH
mmetsp:Transcript_115041/g.245723  ORF Transcript_115041/g.245723 Transcript_115041/m.245723 type:complete len:262 (-) Transcript_115041:11-796(-)